MSDIRSMKASHVFYLVHVQVLTSISSDNEKQKVAPKMIMEIYWQHSALIFIILFFSLCI